MTAVQLAGAAVAVALVLWPQIKFAATWLAVAAASAAGGDGPARPAVIGPTFTDAVAHLAKVRARLLTTDSLGDEQKKAIEVLTLALVAGSDK